MSPVSLFHQVSELGFMRVLQLVSMDINLKVILNVGFFFVLLTWVLVESWKQRRSGENLSERVNFEGDSKVFTKMIVLANVVILVSYVGFCVYNVWNMKILPFESVTSVVTWALSSFVTCYIVKVHKMFPVVVIIWWFAYGVLDILLIFHYFVSYFNKIESSSTFVSKANFVDIASFPLSILLCFNAFNYPYKHAIEVEEPLLQKEALTEANVNDDAFSKAGIWSKLTFRWLNPLFKKGRVKKIELSDIPSIPQSEAADNAASLLEESLSKQKNQASLLPNAIFNAIWKPLAVNAIFAGNHFFDSGLLFCVLNC